MVWSRRLLSRARSVSGNGRRIGLDSPDEIRPNAAVTGSLRPVRLAYPYRRRRTEYDMEAYSFSDSRCGRSPGIPFGVPACSTKMGSPMALTLLVLKKIETGSMTGSSAPIRPTVSALCQSVVDADAVLASLDLLPAFWDGSNRRARPPIVDERSSIRYICKTAGPWPMSCKKVRLFRRGFTFYVAGRRGDGRPPPVAVEGRCSGHGTV